MSRVDEDRRTEQVHDQKKLEQQKTAKEKEASAQKFKQTIASKQVATQKAESGQKEQQQKQSFNQNLLMSRQGIANRTSAERLVKGRDETQKMDQELTGSRDKDVKKDADMFDDKTDSNQEQQTASRLERPVEKLEEKENQEQGQQQQGQGQGQNQTGAGAGGQQQGQQHKDDESTAAGLGGIGAAGKLGKSGSASQAEGAQSPTKIAIGKTQRAAAAERIAPQVLQGVVDKISVMCTQGMNEFQIQLKDDVLGGGTLRVSLKDKKMKINFTLKDATAKNLLESSKGQLMRMFERKGLTLESMEVNLRSA